MSRLAKKIIPVPANTEVSWEGDSLTVKGPCGVLSRKIPRGIELVKEEGGVKVLKKGESSQNAMDLGSTAAHLKNMIAGSLAPFSKKLIVEGIGFKGEVGKGEISLSLGFSHPVKVAIPSDLKVVYEKGVISISGIDKESVGQFAARLREFKKPEPYKGKGIRYEGEVIRRKQGKKTV